MTTSSIQKEGRNVEKQCYAPLPQTMKRKTIRTTINNSGIISSHPFNEYTYQSTSKTYYLYLLGLQNSQEIFGLHFGIGGNLPYQISNKIYVVPYVKGLTEMNLQKGFESKEPSTFDTGFKLGSDVAISLNNDTYLLLGAGLKSNIVLSSFDDDIPSENRTRFMIHIGITL